MSEKNCSACVKIRTIARNLIIDVDNYNFQNDILLWIDLPIIDQNNQDHFMSQKLERQYIDPKDLSIEDLLKTLPKSKEDTKEKEAIANAKKKIRNSHLLHQRTGQLLDVIVARHQDAYS